MAVRHASPVIDYSNKIIDSFLRFDDMLAHIKPFNRVPDPLVPLLGVTTLAIAFEGEYQVGWRFVDLELLFGRSVLFAVAAVDAVAIAQSLNAAELGKALLQSHCLLKFVSLGVDL